MNAVTKLSVKGQIVIPKDVRERLGLAVGEEFDVVERNDDLLLRRRNRPTQPATEAVANAVREMRAVYQYDGPPVSQEDMDKAVLAATIAKHGNPQPRS